MLEIILVLVLIGVAAAILIPSVSGTFTLYHIERAGEDMVHRLAQTRLAAMEAGVPYAFSFRPETDQFLTWSCEPLNTNLSLYGNMTSAVASGDAYDRHQYELNDRVDNKEFRFLGVELSEPLTHMGLSDESRSDSVGLATADSVASSTLLARHKQGLSVVSSRSMAALQIPGLQLGDVAPPLVFEPDGSVDRDAVLRIANRAGHYVEISVQALTGTITSSRAKTAADAAAEGIVITTTADQPHSGIVAPTRSRETRREGN